MSLNLMEKKRYITYIHNYILEYVNIIMVNFIQIKNIIATRVIKEY